MSVMSMFLVQLKLSGDSATITLWKCMFLTCTSTNIFILVRIGVWRKCRCVALVGRVPGGLRGCVAMPKLRGSTCQPGVAGVSGSRGDGPLASHPIDAGIHCSHSSSVCRKVST